MFNQEQPPRRRSLFRMLPSPISDSSTTEVFDRAFSEAMVPPELPSPHTPLPPAAATAKLPRSLTAEDMYRLAAEGKAAPNFSRVSSSTAKLDDVRAHIDAPQRTISSGSESSMSIHSSEMSYAPPRQPYVPEILHQALRKPVADDQVLISRRLARANIIAVPLLVLLNLGLLAYILLSGLKASAPTVQQQTTVLYSAAIEAANNNTVQLTTDARLGVNRPAPTATFEVVNDRSELRSTSFRLSSRGMIDNQAIQFGAYPELPTHATDNDWARASFVSTATIGASLLDDSTGAGGNRRLLDTGTLPPTVLHLTSHCVLLNGSTIVGNDLAVSGKLVVNGTTKLDVASAKQLNVSGVLFASELQATTLTIQQRIVSESMRLSTLLSTNISATSVETSSLTATSISTTTLEVSGQFSVPAFNVAALTATVVSAGSLTAGFVSTGALTATSMSVSGAIDAGSMTTSGAIESGSITTSGSVDAGSMTTTGTIEAGSVSASGAIESASITTFGAIESASITTTGAIESGSLTTSGLIDAGSITTSGAIESGSITTTGLIDAGSMTTSGAIESGSITTSGLIDAGSISTTSLIASASISSVSIRGTSMSAAALSAASGFFTNDLSVATVNATSITSTSLNVTSLTAASLSSGSVSVGAVTAQTLTVQGAALLQGSLNVEGQITLFGVVPIGAIISHYVDLSGADGLARIKQLGFAVCDGTTPVSQGISNPVISVATPDLNSNQYFLRGAQLGQTGVIQQDAMQNHTFVLSVAGDHMHTISQSSNHTHAVSGTGRNCGGGSEQCIGTDAGPWSGQTAYGGAHSHTASTAGQHVHEVHGPFTSSAATSDARVASETRPKNMAVLFIMRVK
eukprot:TRINITY_DN1061_c0_g1_i1.p1 TRINITY_DN1061_c0_g1~~TRINITY_DN1061_c0_g1_i1.p1  ORF type:complete len:862 (-),score=173.30 TRINITY_DN1061_c0_g1_i1:137-2722(-)